LSYLNSLAKLGWMGGAAAAARAGRAHALLFARMHTGRAHVLRPLSRAVLVCRFNDGFGPRAFACGLSEPCLCLGVSGMVADCTCVPW
jgi:hypothetical protein